MIFVLGLACIAWTVFELVRMSREIPSRVRPQASPRAPRASRPHRLPLAAWDEQGRPIFVEDVSIRGSR